MKSIWFYDTDLGKIGIAEEKGFITDIIFGEYSADFPAEERETPLIKEAYRQIDLYLKGKLRGFDLPLYQQGTAFQEKVWNALREIPYGETRSYKDIAVAIGNEKATRAVGSANNKNSLPIVIPCHRVIGADGKLVGYGGGLNIKEFLLSFESSNKR